MTASSERTRRALEFARRLLEITCVPVSDQYADLARLAAAVYPEGGDLGSTDYLRWEYGDNPAGRAQGMVGLKGDRMIGQYVAIPLHFQIENQRLLGSLGVNVMTHPDFRGRGVFQILADETLTRCPSQGIAFTIGFPNPNSHPGFVRDLGFATLGYFALYVLPLDAQQLVRAPQVVARPALRWLLSSLAPLVNRLRRRRPPEAAPAQRLDKVNEALVSVWAKAFPAGANGVIHSLDYVRWRYEQNPVRRYGFYAAPGGAETPRAAVVTRSTQIQGVRCGLIVDAAFESSAEGEIALLAALRTSIDNFEKEGLGLAGALVNPAAPLARHLRSLGFMRCPQALTPQPFPLIARWHLPTPPPATFSTFQNWHLMMGDYDVV